MSETTGVGRKISPTAVFRKRDFVLMWLAQLVSTAGSSLTDLAAGIYVYQETGSAFLVGVTLMATAVPEPGRGPASPACSSTATTAAR